MTGTSLISDALARLEGAKRVALPARPRLALATLAERPPAGSDWLHEVKFDGYRTAARLDHGKVALLTRNGLDWTTRFPEIAGVIAQLPARQAILDGEVVALDGRGLSSFSLLQTSLRSNSTTALVYEAFDLLYLDGYDLTDVPLGVRKETLSDLLASAATMLKGGRATIRLSEHLDADGPDVFEHACRLHLEGIVSKRRGSLYHAGRGDQWLKSKCSRADEFVIGGFTPPRGQRAGFGALLLGTFEGSGRVDGHHLRYVGKVGTGFNDAQLALLRERMDALRRSASPFGTKVPDQKTAVWVDPQLIVEVRYAEWTHDERLRQASYRGLRTDKEPQEVTMAALGRADPETEPNEPLDTKGPPREHVRSADRSADDDKVAGVKLTSANRVLYPEQGTTKLELANYYLAVAEPLLAYLAGRPLSLVRCPEGRAKQCFYQKHPGASFTQDIRRVTLDEQDGPGEYLVARTIADVIGLVQNGVLEMHVLGCRADALDTPDLLVFDLDPGPDVAWTFVKATARDLRDLLHDLGLPSFVRTTGGKGLHVVVPILPEREWDDVKEFAKAVAVRLASALPKQLTTSMSKAERKGKIFLDYLRNARGSTSIANYSTRARAGAPVAVPLRWSELTKTCEPNAYDVISVPRRLASLASDPWDGFEAARMSLTDDMLSNVGVAKRGKRGRGS